MAFSGAELLEDTEFAPVTRGVIARGVAGLGVVAGDVLMVHVRLSALGWVVGGIDTVVRALVDVVGAEGTLVAFCGWDDSPYHVAFWPRRWQSAYDELPGFAPEVSSARRDFGRFPERLRTWPGALRSAHPEVSFAALGAQAGGLLAYAGPAVEDPWGRDGVLGRLTAAGGKVLMLGAPLKTLTLCHHAEAIAEVRGKRYHSYRMPVRTAEGDVWREYTTLDTFYGALPYVAGHSVADLAQQAVAAGAGVVGRVGPAESWVFDARRTVAAVRAWIEAAF
ncbi:aminoglycoside 3-N-acetyltransferase [Kribbella sp. NPDC051770]|uniref:aminoglycoside 3-N-acetyltransferase n=1 Tax=Kribbella sp. NPDC051770 TaxID=3155413 RepID=UPI00343EBFA8